MYLRWDQLWKIILTIVGALLALMGLIWFLQSINILPGSFMTGDIRWALYGCIAMFAGVGLLWYTNRRRP
jgi:hypothetical protein